MKRIFITASTLIFPFNAAYAGCTYNCNYLTDGDAMVMFGLLLFCFAGLGVWWAIDSFKKNEIPSLIFCVLLTLVNLSGLIAMYFFGGYGFLGAVAANGLLMYLTPKGV